MAGSISWRNARKSGASAMSTDTKPIRKPTQATPAKPPITGERVSTTDAIDRALHAAQAKFTAGLSPAGLALAWRDWAVHLANQPARRMDLTRTRSPRSRPGCPSPGAQVRSSTSAVTGAPSARRSGCRSPSERTSARGGAAARASRPPPSCTPANRASGSAPATSGASTSPGAATTSTSPSGSRPAAGWVAASCCCRARSSWPRATRTPHPGCTARTATASTSCRTASTASCALATATPPHRVRSR